MNVKCLNCSKRREKQIIHNTNDNFCSSDCKRKYYDVIRANLSKIENEIKSLYQRKLELNNHKQEVFGK